MIAQYRREMNKFVPRLNELLKYSNKKQVEICKSLGITKQKMSKWKLGYNEPCLDELMMIAAYFDVTVDYLLGMNEDK